MPIGNAVRSVFVVCTLLCLAVSSHSAPPAGFVQADIPRPDGASWSGVVGVTFAADGTMFAWERGGRIWILDEGDPLPNPPPGPLLDISDEVGGWRDFGLLGVALDPAFLVNGHIYLMYVVDRHHLMNCSEDPSGVGEPVCGPGYNPNTDEYFNATIGRITRYTVDFTSGTTVDYSSRKVLLGETVDTGIPILHQSHGTGSLAFGTDGTLIATTGDGASYSSTDTGSRTETYYAQALQDGIIRPEENVGSFRSQMLSSLNGKVLRLDKNTGDGLASNPFYDPAEPRSTRSRVWALGLRNPFRMTMRPDTGSHDPADGAPGSIYIGDVGWITWEDLHVSSFGGENFGWPVFEGMGLHGGYSTRNTPNEDAPNPLFGINGCTQEFFYFRELIQQDSMNPTTLTNSCDGSPIPADVDTHMHTRPVIDWRHGSNNARWPSYDASGNAVHPQIGQADGIGQVVEGTPFQGNSSTGGVWYTGDDFPPEYKNTYFHGDYGNRWIRNIVLGPADFPVEVRVFDPSPGPVIHFATHPINGHLYYVTWGSTIRKVTYEPTGNRVPTAVASADVTYGTSPLTVQFTGDQSTDVDGTITGWDWDFGDGNTSSEANPQQTFVAGSANPESFDVRLTVTDNEGSTATAQVLISTNNTPPNVSITSPAEGTEYPLSGDTVYDLRADIFDTEHTEGALACEWVTILHHNDHTHQEPLDSSCSTTTTISPLGCGDETYYFRVTLRVTDPEGLSATDEVTLLPDCDGSGGSDVTAPTAPGNLQATNITDATVDLSWASSTDDTGVAGYTIYQGGQPVGNTAGTTFTVSGLAADTDYSFTVTASDGAGNESGPSNVLNVRTDAPPPPDTTPPEAPTTLDAVAQSSSSIQLSWSGATDDRGVVGYNVYRDGAAAPVGNTADETFSDVGLAANTLYSYTVTALDAAGNESLPSPSDTATTLPPPSWQGTDIGGVAAAGSFVDNNGVITVEASGADIWNRADEFYYVYQTLEGDGSITARVASLDNTDPWAKAGVMVRETLADNSAHAMMVVTAENGAAFQYRTSTGNRSAPSGSGDGVTIAPAWVRIVREGDVLTGYLSADGVNWSERDSVTIAMTDPVYVGLANTSHNDGVLATAVFDGLGISQVGAPPAVSISAPANGAILSESDVTVQYALSGDLTNVEHMHVILNGSGQPNEMDLDGNILLAGLADGDYTLELELASAGHEVLATDTVTFTVAGPDTTAPTAPANLVATSVGENAIGLGWDPATDDRGVAGYTIYQGGQPVGNTAGTTFTVSGLAADTDYSFTVTASDGAGNESGPSNVLNVRTDAPPPPDTTPPEAPTTLDAVAQSSSSIQLSWSGATDDRGVVGYNVYRDGAAAPVGNTADETFSDVGLAANTLYSYTVTALDAAGNESLPSPSDTATTLPPPSWQGTDIGGVAAAGSFVDNNGVITVEASGADIWNRADEFYYVYQTLEGDGSITARVASLDNTDPWAKAGVMVRETLADNSAHAMMVVTAENGAAFQYRTSTGNRSAPSGSGDGVTIAPAWVRIVREGDVLTGYLSADGVNWSERDSVTIAMTDPVYVGLANTSHNDGVLATAVFDGLGISQVGAPPAVSISAPANGAILSESDVTVQYALSGDLTNVEHMHVILNGSGQPNEMDLDGNILLAGLADGDYTLELELASAGHEVLATDTVTFTVAGPDTTAPTAPANLVATSVGENAIGLGWDPATDDRGVAGYTIYQGGQPVGNTAGTTFTVSGLAADTDYSFTVTASDGAGNESGPSNVLNVRTDAPPPPDTTPPEAPTTLDAVAQSSSSIQLSWSGATDDRGVVGYNVYRDGAAAPVGNTADETFSDVGLAANTLYSYTVTALDAAGNESLPSPSDTATTLPPPSWQGTDIGGVAAAGSFVDNNGVITVEASGADIWNRADEFYYVYQTLEGDGSITARVASLDNTDPWAKAGVMVRETLADNSAHAMMVVTAENGAAFQYRTSTGNRSAPSGSGDGVTIAPAWVRIVREGDVLTGYLSADGVNWSERDSVTIAMTDPVYVGLANTSHNDGVLATAVFDGINIAEADADTTPPSTPGNLSGSASYSTDFQNAVGYSVGPKPHGIAIADLNGDGHLDLVTADSVDRDATGYLSVLLGAGDGTFGASDSYPVGTYPKAVIAGDFDGDGAADLASVDQNSNSVSVLLGNGDGTFGARTAYSVCNKAHELAAADFDADGDLDLAVACHGGFDISLLLGNGDGTFGDAIDQLSGDGPHSVVAADFNGDGNVDLAVANHDSDDIAVLLGNGNGTFAASVNYGAGNGPHGIRAGDLDGDGNMDLVTANDVGDSVSVLMGDGSGSFGAAMEYSVGVEPKSVAIADIDRNGSLDVVASNTGGNYPTCCVASGGDNVSILYGNGDGTLANREDVYVGLTPFAVKVADLNADGLLDLATANWDDAEAGVVLFSPAGSSSITLTWDAATDTGVGVAGYRIYRNGGTSPYAETTETRFTDPGLSGDTEFSYEVTAIDRASPPNESLPAGPVAITTLQ